MKVYLISSEINGSTLYKIGITKREVKDRLKELKTGNAADLNIINIFESKWASKIESNLHGRFILKNISGEWFDMSEEDVKSFTEICKMLHNNFEILSTQNTWIIDKKIL
jgi:hypothetical protein